MSAVPDTPPGTKWPALAKLVAKYESGATGYDAVNGSINGSRVRGGSLPGGLTKYYGKPTTQCTLQEIRNLQTDGFRDKDNRLIKLFAVGAYQMTPGPLNKAIETTGLSKNTLFSEEVQGVLFDYFVEQKRPIIGKFLRGEIPETEVGRAVNSLSGEFAVFQAYSTWTYKDDNNNTITVNPGRGAYDGDSAGNKAGCPPEVSAQVLLASRRAGPNGAVDLSKYNLTTAPQTDSPCGVYETATSYFLDIDTEKYKNTPIWVFLEINGTFEKKTFLYYISNQETK